MSISLTLNPRSESAATRQGVARYTPELDGLRGIAVLAVMMYHTDAPYLLQGGFIGVDMFFVLSGFLITTLLVQEFDESGSICLKNFYIRRVLRLAPALLVLLLTLCLVSFFALDAQKAKSNYIDALISLFYLSNWARALSIHPPDFIAHTWSLSIEEQFYILWPCLLFVMLIFSKDRKVILAATAAIAIVSWMLRNYMFASGTSIERIYNGLDTHADALMVGCALGIFLCSGLANATDQNRLRRNLFFAAVLSCLCLVIVSLMADWRSRRMVYYGYFAVELSTAILIWQILTSPRAGFRSLFSPKWLVWIGSISYGLYLWHYPIYRLLRDLGFQTPAVVIVGPMLTFLVAALSYYFLERPILTLKKHFGRENPNLPIQRTTFGGGELRIPAIPSGSESFAEKQA
jgi:peptidoglycan/LPS O-acetylase OafA/YrhL